jgi:uncharacterized membrane protein
MEIDGRALLAIVGMALVTYATRAGGLWLMERVPPSPRLETWLRHVPGAVLAAIVAPAVFTGGWYEALAAGAAMLTAARTGSVLGAMAVGVGLVVVLRAIL